MDLTEMGYPLVISSQHQQRGLQTGKLGLMHVCVKPATLGDRKMLTDSKKCLSFLPVLSSHCIGQFQCQERPHKFTLSSLPLTQDKLHVFIYLQGTQGSSAAPFCVEHWAAGQ